ncbi:ribonuclease HIII [Candidatus Cloacimonadota bacterium]
MHQELSNYISKLLSAIEKTDIKLIDSRDIQYGQQLKLSDGESEIKINVYYSMRKGVSVVLGGKNNSSIYLKLHKLLYGKTVEVVKHDWKRWAGTDESGKGDFFGPLVVCGFVMEAKFKTRFQEMGIKDSKKMNDKEVIKIAEYLFSNHRRSFEILILQPAKYNELYKKFSEQNKKLNELLAWMHGRVILNLHEKLKFEGAVIDKFAGEQVLKGSLKDLDKIALIQRYRAEDDLAVACASILARYKFLKTMDELSSKFKMDLPKGASQKVIEVASAFSSKYGKDKLNEVAKIHFKTYSEV